MAASSASSSRSATWRSRPSSRHDESQVIAADWTGEIRVWDVKDGRRLANLAVNPAPIAVRIEQAKQALAAAQAEADSLAKQLAPFQNAIAPANAALAQAQAKVTAAEQAAAKQTALVQQLEQALEGQAGRGRRSADHAAGRRAARRAVGRGPGGGREGDRRRPSQAEKAATEALAAAKAATEKALADKTAHDPALAAATAALKAAATPEAAAQAAAELAKQAQKVGRADPGDRGRRHAPVGRRAGSGSGDRRQERGAPGRGQRAIDRQGRHAGRPFGPRRLEPRRPGSSRRRQGPGRRPHRPPDRDDRPDGRQEGARPGERRQGRGREGPGRKEGTARCRPRQGPGPQGRGRRTRRRKEAVRSGQGRPRVRRAAWLVIRTGFADELQHSVADRVSRSQGSDRGSLELRHALHDGIILSVDRYVSDPPDGTFFMRLEIESQGFGHGRDEFARPRVLDARRCEHGMNWRIGLRPTAPSGWRSWFRGKAIAWSTCSGGGRRANWMPRSRLSISNHADLRREGQQAHGIPFHHRPVAKESKAEQQAQVEALLTRTRDRPGRARSLHADHLAPIPGVLPPADHQHPSFLPAGLQRRRTLITRPTPGG